MKINIQLAIIVLTTMVFILDLLTPRGVAVWMFYLIPLFLANWAANRFSSFFCAAVFTCLTVLGFFFSPQGVSITLSILNRAMGVTAFWIVALLIARRMAAADALSASAEEFQDLYDKAPNGYVSVGGDGLIKRYNKRFGDMLGYETEKLLGMPVINLYADTPEGREKAKKVFHRFLSGEIIFDEELQMQKSDGTLFWISLSVNAIHDPGGRILGSRSVVQDVTERKKTDEVIRERERQLSALISTLPGVAYRCRNDKDFTTEFVSDGVSDLTGYPASDFQEHRRHFGTLIHPEDKDRILTGIQTALSEKRSFEVTYRIITATGREKWVWERGLGIQDEHEKIQALEGFVTDITERRQMEEELEASERKYRELVGNANSIILRWNREGEITFMNEFGQNFFGYPEAEIIGSHVIGTIVPEKESTGRDLRPLMEQIIANPKNFERNINENIQRNGELAWIDWTNKIVLDEQGQIKEILSIGSDITERRHTEEALKASEMQFRDLLENVQLVAVLLDLNGKVTFCNEYLVDLTGYTRDELNGSDWFDWMVPDALPEVKEVFLRGLKSGEITPHFENSISTKNGEIRHIAWSNTLLRDSAGRIIGTASIGEDITERKKAEEELNRYREHLEELVKDRTAELKDSQTALISIVEDLNQKTEELRAANERLKEIDRLKSIFIASMSHELRTPLNSIIGFSSILQNEWLGPLSKEQKENLQTILRAGKHLLSLINDVIDVSKIEAGKVESLSEDFDLHGLVMEAVELVKKEASEKGLEFLIESTHVEMHTDRRRLMQCIVNLLSNAVKFTEKGSVRVSAQRVKGQVTRVKDKEYTVKCQGEEGIPSLLATCPLPLNKDFVEISVEDTGIGIMSEDIPKLFSSFIRLESPLKAKVPGTGLGLYLTKKIVAEVLKGNILVSSRHGEGSRFTLLVPTIRG